MIHGGSWECGYCGDSGFLRRRVPRKREVPQITLTLSLSWDLDLNDTWEELKKTVRDLTGSRSDMPLSLLGRTILHEISLGMVRAQKHPSDARLKKIEAFLYDTNDLCARCSLNDLIGTVKTGNAMYSDEAALTDQKCGKFWRSLMQAIPTYAYYTDNSLQDLFRNLSNWYTLGFSEDGEGSSDRQWELEETFQKYWSEYVLLNPDAAFEKKHPQGADSSPREQWEMPPEKYADGYQRGLSGRQSKPQYPATDSPDNTIYRYCMVKTPKSDRVYSYLSGEQTVNVGDMVEVPFGKDGNIILAEVVEIRSCTAANAPWPPERTKSIIRIAAQEKKGN